MKYRAEITNMAGVHERKEFEDAKDADAWLHKRTAELFKQGHRGVRTWVERV